MREDEQKDIGKVAAKAGVWYVISSVLVKGISVITTPIFTRILSTQEYGNVATFSSWYSILVIFCSLNLTYSIGRAKQDFPEKVDCYIGSMTVLSAIISIIYILITILFWKPISAFMELSNAMLILLMIYLFFTPAISFAQNGYRYRYKYKQNIAIAWYTALSNVVVSLVFIFLFKENKDVLRVIGMVLPAVILSVYFWMKLIKDGNISFNKKYCKYALKLSLPLVLHTVSLNILAQSDRIFITKSWGASATAIYSLAYSYGILLTLVTSAISESWLPWFHDTYAERKFEEIKKNVKPLIVLGCYIGLACIALTPEAVSVLGGKSYSEGIYCVPPIVLGIICQYIYTHYVNIELHLKKTKYVSVGTVLAASLNIALNALFVPKFGFVAAAYTTLVGYVMLFVMHLFITRKILNVKIYDDWYMIKAILGVAAVTVLIVFSYKNTLLRYTLIVIGFGTFLVVFRKYILEFIQMKVKK